ncbi:MAG: CHAT domain-containing protein [Cyanobacteria bacterium P01_D01_bin.156]
MRILGHLGHQQQLNRYIVLAATWLGTFGLSPAWCQIIPIGNSTITGGSTIQIQGGASSADGANLFHQFESFNINASETVTFIAPDAVDNILGRVRGGYASIIDGHLGVSNDANLWLINPAGILFGRNAQLNLAGDFTAATADAIGFAQGWFNDDANYQTLVGTPYNFAFITDPAYLVNLGDLQVASGQNLQLLGGHVINAGTLSAPSGSITVSAVANSNRVNLSQTGQVLSLDLAPVTDGLTSDITPLDLPELLTGYSGEQADTLSVNADGTIQLGQATNLTVKAGDTLISGTLKASGDEGGQVSILGDRLILMDASVQANGINQGGQIYIGGNYQGNGPLSNAQQTFVSQGTELNASALDQGDGGTIIVWADESTSFHGTATSQGGHISGDGGFIEISGKSALEFTGEFDVSAADGEFGTVLFDPKNIEIVDGAGNSNGDAEFNAPVGGTLNALVNEDTWFTIHEETLESWTGNVILQAHHDIIIRNLGGDNTLAFEAGTGSIEFVANADNVGGGSFRVEHAGDQITTAGRDISISGNNIILYTLDTSHNAGGAAGDITLSAPNYINIRESLVGNNISITSNGIDFDGGNNTVRGNTLSIAPDDPSLDISLGAATDTSGALDILQNDILSLQNGFTSISIGRIGDTGTITLDSSVTDGGANPFQDPVQIVEARTLKLSDQAITWTITDNKQGNLNSHFSNGLSFENIDSIVGHATLNGTLQGAAGNDVVNITGTNAGTFNGITFANIANLEGAGGDDQFIFGNSAAITGTLDGGSGSNTLDYGAYITDVAIDLEANTAPGTGGISNIQTFIGGSGTNTIQGTNNNDTITLTGANTGSINSVDFQGFETVIAGDGDDSFLVNGGTWTQLDGGTGNNTLDYSSSTLLSSGTNNIWNLTGVDTGNGPGVNNFENVQNLKTGNQSDQINYLTSGALISGELDGGDGALTLVGDNLAIGDALQGTGQLIIQPDSLDRDIHLGGSAALSALGISTTELSNISADFTDMIIGHPNGTHTVSLRSDVTSPVPITIRAPSGDGRISSGGHNLEAPKITLSAAQGISITKLTATNEVLLQSSNGSIGIIITLVSPTAPLPEVGIEASQINLAAAQNITTGYLTAINDVTLESNNGAINTESVNGSSIDLSAAQNINTGDLTATNGATLESRNTSVVTQDINASDINLSAAQDINANSLTATNSAILVSNNGVITTQTVDASEIDFSASQNIVINGTITADNGTTLESRNASVITQDIDAVDITLSAAQNVGTGNLITTNNTELTSTNGVITTQAVTASKVDFLADQNIVVNDSITATNGTTLESRNASIITQDITATDISLSATQDIGTGNLIVTNNTELTSTNGVITTQAVDASGVDFSADQNIVVTDTLTVSGDIILQSNNASVTTQTIDASNIDLFAAQNVVTNDLTAADSVTLESTNGVITTQAIAASDISLSTPQNITTTNLAASNDVILQSDNGSINTQGVNASQILLSAAQNISTTDLTAVNGVTLESDQSINVDDITTSNTFNGGDVDVTAGTTITTERIDTTSLAGAGGDVTLNAPDAIQVDSIRAEGGTNGGNVDITTESFTATDSFTNLNGNTASISTAATNGTGSITIRHGGNGSTAFDVGNSSVLGTDSAITSGTFQINPNSSFFNSYILGNIAILTQDLLSSLTIGLPSLPNSPSLGNSLPSPPIIREGLNPLDNAKASLEAEDYNSALFERLEMSYSEQFKSHLNLYERVSVSPTSLESAKQTLNNVEQVLGIKPGVVYVYFLPSESKHTALPDPNATNPNDELGLLLLTSNGQTIRKKVEGVTRADVMASAEDFFAQITNSMSASSQYLPPAQQLYSWFIAPIENELQEQQIQSLAMVMDTGLRTLPVAALHNGDEFLIERYSLGVIPSFSLTDFNPQNFLYKHLDNTQLLAMGASQFPSQQPLPAVPDELDIVTEAFPNSEVFLNDKFTLDNLKSQVANNNFGIVHLASHGVFEPGQPRNSYIQLWDQPLQLDQVHTLGLQKADIALLVLSACNTALGDREAEYGFAGLAVNAGVQTSVASLWPISDEGTLGLMTYFYDRLQDHTVRATALRQAQLAMLTGDLHFSDGTLYGLDEQTLAHFPELEYHGRWDFQHPFYWSTYTLVGSPW